MWEVILAGAGLRLESGWQAMSLWGSTPQPLATMPR